MRHSLVALLTLFGCCDGTASTKHRLIRAFAEALVATAPSENLFLCPMNVTDGVDLSSWPSEEVTIDGTLCMDYDELMEVDKRGDFLKCLTEVTNATTHALDMLGIDASIIDGTLLGWQRHDKGHIPWDVDADLTIMQSHCRRAFKKHATQQHKNMAALLKDYLPTDSYYRVAAIKYGVGSELDPDEWDGCNTTEIRVMHKYRGVSCHADVFQMLQSTDPSSPCQRCPIPVNSSATAVCRSSLSDQCGLLEDILPMRWDTLNGVAVKVPANPEAALRSHFGSTSVRLINLKEIPRNYKYGSYRLVIGEANSDDDDDEIIIDNGSTTDGIFLSDDLDAVKASDKLSADTTVTNKGALSETVKSPLLRTETTALPELQELQAERFISTISVSFVACLSIFGIALVYFFVFKSTLLTGISSAPTTPSASYRQVRSPPRNV